ncbi:heavy metal-binding domain-containing protein [Glycomyces harbinensis]|uniref:Heavy-metal-associated domain-containing protein n=1 Tax=Glycomyces harbinensis TaxID=58114 RepID=A0A1G6R6V1_9ACTN|nr:heavy metal-binding domain-containing protein [Glycomyces harbinensis]SDD00171.1 hypothetical protein SAMN05216270_101323 [Glycomyces harbinensis]
MNTPARLGLYAAGLAALFAGAYLVSGAVVPASAVDDWKDEAAPEHEDMGMETDTEDHGGHEADPVRGLAIEQDGYLLSEVAAPTTVGAEGTLAFDITAPDGTALTRYTESHEKELHLIVVRADGAEFRHVHPEFDGETWSLPWSWDQPGTYRVFADFVPGDADEELDVTLSRTVEVTGDYAPRPENPVTRTASVDGFEATLTGDLAAGATTELTVEITRDGEPVTALEPYLGAWGHLVALREGDLGYLHVHPEGDDPEPGTTSGPAITFATAAPTEGRYLLYLDFQVDGQVHTAPFVLDTEGAGPTEPGDATDSPASDSEATESESPHGHDGTEPSHDDN